MWNNCYYNYYIVIIIIILICRKLGSVGPVQQKIKLPLPNQISEIY